MGEILTPKISSKTITIDEIVTYPTIPISTTTTTTIPNAFIYTPIPGLPAREDVNAVATPASERRLTVSAESSVIPVVYGRDQVGAKIFAVKDGQDGYIYIGCIWCLGEIDSIEHVDNGDIHLDASILHNYTGTLTQTVDSWLQGADPSYIDDLIATVDGRQIGVAYSVIKWPLSENIANIHATIKGKKVRDPRNGNAVAWSDNPSLCFADFLESRTYGSGRDVHSICNALLYSNDISNAAWTKVNCTATQVAAPDSSVAWKITTTSANSRIRQVGIDIPHGAATLSGRFVVSGAIIWTDAGQPTEIRYYIADGSFNEYGTGTFTITTTPTTYTKVFGFSLSNTETDWIVRFELVDQTVGKYFYIQKVRTIIDCIFGADYYVETTSTAFPGPLYVGVDDPGLIECADADDEIIPVSNNKRRTLGLTIEQVADTLKYEAAFMLYTSCFVSRGDYGRTILKLDQAESTSSLPAYSDVDGNIVEGTVKISKKGIGDAPTVVTVQYTETLSQDGTELHEWRDGYASAKRDGVDAGTVVRRESKLSLPGIQTYEQAYRAAVEYLNYYYLGDLVVEFETFDEGINLIEGDLIDFKHDTLGLVDYKPMRVIGIDMTDDHGFIVKCEEYDPGMYSDAVETTPFYADTNLPLPSDIPPVSNLQIVEEIYQLQSGIWASRFRISWDHIPYYYRHYYEVEVSEVVASSDAVWKIESHAEEVVTSAIKEGVTYSVSVTMVSELGYRSIVTYGEQLAQGKYLPPGDVLSAFITQLNANTVRLSWVPAVDLDIWGYEIREASASDYTDWAIARFITQTDALVLDVTNVSKGYTVYLIKAIDSVKQYSENAASVSITMGYPGDVDENSFIVYEIGGELRCSWAAVTSGYVAGYEIRYSLTGVGNWDSAIVLDRVDSLRLTSKELPAATYDIYIKAYDSINSYSVNAAVKSVAVTIDINAFEAASPVWDSTEITLSNMYEYTLARSDPTVYFVTYDSTDTWNSLYPSAMSTYTNALYSYHSNVTSSLTTDWHDVGQLVSGDWVSDIPVTAISGSYTEQMDLSPDTVEITSFTSMVAQFAARYVRLKAEALTSSTMLITIPRIYASVYALTREETGTATSLNSRYNVTVPTGGSARIDLDPAVTVTETNSATRTLNVRFITPTSLTGNRGIYGQGNQVTGTLLYTYEGDLRFSHWHSSIVTAAINSVITLQAGTFYHVQVTFDTDDIFRLYVNGVLVGQDTCTDTLWWMGGSYTTAIGNVSGGGGRYVGGSTTTAYAIPFGGQIFSFWEHSVVQSAAELKEELNQDRGDSANLIRGYDFDTGSGTSILDYGPNSDDATLTDCTWAHSPHPFIVLTDNTYIYAKLVSITPLGSRALDGIEDGIIIATGERSSFLVYVISSMTGQSVAENFRWTFRGI